MSIMEKSERRNYYGHWTDFGDSAGGDRVYRIGGRVVARSRRKDERRQEAGKPEGNEA